MAGYSGTPLSQLGIEEGHKVVLVGAKLAELAGCVVEDTLREAPLPTCSPTTNLVRSTRLGGD